MAGTVRNQARLDALTKEFEDHINIARRESSERKS